MSIIGVLVYYYKYRVASTCNGKDRQRYNLRAYTKKLKESQ